MSEHAHSDIPADLAVMPPGPQLLDVLSGLDATQLSAHDAVVVVAAWERQQAFCAAQQARVLAELVAKPEYAKCSVPDKEPEESLHQHDRTGPCADEVSLALRCTPGFARSRLVMSMELLDVFPETLNTLEEGLIDSYKAQLIVTRTRVLGDVARRWVQAKVLPVAVVKTAAGLDRALRAAVIAADPDAAEQRRKDAAQQRRVERPEPADAGGVDGMARMGLIGPAEDLLALWTGLDAAARHARQVGDARSLQQLRFDILCGLAWSGLDIGHLGCCNPACAPGGGESSPFGHTHGRAAQVHVTVPASTLFPDAGDAGRQAGDEEREHVPAFLEGFGPIAAGAARRVSTEASLRRLLTDGVDGRLLEYGRSTYTPPQELADFVIARDVTCRFPACDRPGREADIDHRRAWSDGGTTGESNTWCLHEGHHLGKTHHGFNVHTDADGTIWWVTPAGHQYRVDPEVVGPIIGAPPRDPPDTVPPPF